MTSPDLRLPQVLVRRLRRRHARLRRLDPRGAVARRRGHRALRRVLPLARREGRRSGRGGARGDRAADVAALLLARLHASRRRRAAAPGRAAEAAIDLTLRLGGTHCRTLSGQRYPGHDARRGIARTVEGLQRSVDYAGDARRRPVHGEPLQGRRPGSTRSSPSPRTSSSRFSSAWRLAGLRRPVRPVERHRRRLRPDRVPREGEAPRRLDARVRSLPRPGRDPRRDPKRPTAPPATPEAAARRDRQGAERLRRHLPHPAGSASRAGFRSRTA